MPDLAIWICGVSNIAGCLASRIFSLNQLAGKPMGSGLFETELAGFAECLDVVVPNDS